MPEEPKNKGQIGRFLRYRSAFERLDAALEEGWFLEAITLEESIISDRLISTLHHLGKNVNPKIHLKDLIDKNRRLFENSEFNFCGTIFDDLDEWRLKRNACVHSYCKFDEDSSFSENAVKDLEDTLLSTAREGRQLVDLARHFSEFAKKQYQEGGTRSCNCLETDKRLEG